MSSKSLKEAERVMTICNACRYCEGFCAVFPAMELRRTFTDPDLKYLSNLCHNCRDCYYACQYAPPHEFDVNVPRSLAELRVETYREFAWPGIFSGLFRFNGWWVSFVAAVCVVVALLLVGLGQRPEVLFGIHTGENAFYRVVSYPAMVLTFSVLALFVVIALWRGFCSFWQGTGKSSHALLDLRANLKAISDVLRLKYLDGGGYGCNYPDDRFSMLRKYLHHAVFYGFLFCLASTTVAAFYDHLLHLAAPYPVLSWPVILGSIGGGALLVGAGGLLFFKFTMDTRPALRGTFGMDVAFIALLWLTAFTGILLLILRATPMMGTLLTIHLGMVAGLFLSMPYSKFVHGVYRYAALVRNAAEQGRTKQ